MSAIGHTMATMSRNGGKPGVTSNEVSSGRRGREAGNQTAGRGGQNINHLLSFTLPPRISNSTIPAGPARRARRGAGHYVPFNKERYVNAQYRFLVKPTGDYTAYFADADIFLNWSDILVVLIPTTSALSTASHRGTQQDLIGAATATNATELHEGAACPICLSPPTAPRMTKCGHVYCYPCILHYLTVHDAPAASGSTTPMASTYNHQVPGAGPRSHPTSHPGTPNGSSTVGTSPSSSPPKWKRCPVCWDAVYARDVKAVKWWDPKARADEFEREAEHARSTKIVSDEQLCMRLIERPHLTTLALPQSSTWPTASTSTSEQPLIAQHSAPWHFQPDVMTFSKFMLATPDFLLENLNADLEQLNEEKHLLQSIMMKDEVGLMFVAMAERKVHEQMEKVTNELDTQSVRSRIGFARKELSEHFETERGNRERNAELLSRRQRKRLDREKKESADEEGVVGNVEASERERTQDFLAVQAQRQGGDRAATVATAAAAIYENDPDDSRTSAKEGRATAQRSRRNLNPPAPSSSSFFFYQASSGQNIFLHPLDIKVLLSSFGSYASFPNTLPVSVQGADEGSMNEEMQKRCKYLTHLSKGADIVFIEVDWDKMVHNAEARNEASPVPRSVLKMYEQTLRQRRNRRRDRERREDRAKVRSEEQEQASRPATNARALPIGIGSLARSPVLTAYDGISGSSVGSHVALSPSSREAFLLSGSDAGGAYSDDEFPAPRTEATTELGEEAVAHEESESDALPHDQRRSTRRSSHNKPLPGATTTVWGTPTARGSFANALHHSSRTSGTGHADEEGPDWDSWLEIEEDFIVGARNNPTIREGKGLNRQAKRGESAAHTKETAARSSTTSGGTTPSSIRAIEGPDRTSSDEQPHTLETTPRSTPGKQQKKKKLVLTSGGGGRGTR